MDSLRWGRTVVKAVPYKEAPVGIKLSCLSCGHSLEIGDAYESYRGVVRCWVCRTLLDVALEEGMLRGMRLVSAAAEETRRADDPSGREES